MKSGRTAWKRQWHDPRSLDAEQRLPVRRLHTIVTARDHGKGNGPLSGTNPEHWSKSLTAWMRTPISRRSVLGLYSLPTDLSVPWKRPVSRMPAPSATCDCSRVVSPNATDVDVTEQQAYGPDLA